PARRALFDVHRLCLADGRLFAGPVSRRAAGRLPDTRRSLAHRRRRTIPGLSSRDAAGASPLDHDRPHPVDHQFAQSLRHRLRHDAGRSGAVHANARAMGLHPGDAARRLRPRRGDLGRSARDHDRHRRPLSALERGARGEPMKAFARALRQPGLESIDPVLVILWLALIAIAAVWIAPFVFIVFTSFKANSTVMGSSAFAPPTSLEWGNYFAAWARGRFSTTVFNSAVITIIKVPLGLLISAMAAYA